VSPAIAVRLGKLFGDGGGAERIEDVSGIPTLRAKAA
jgi:hypothetical protein